MNLYDVFQIISLTTLVVKRTCMGTNVYMAGLARKKWRTFQKERCDLLKTQYVFQRIVLGVKSLLQPPTMFFLN